MATMKDRMETITELITDPVVGLELKEASLLLFHAIMWEVHEIRIDRAIRRQKKHGRWIQNVIDVANFNHEMQDL